MSSCPASRCTSELYKLSLSSLSFRPSSRDRKSTRLNSSHGYISYAVFCLKKKKTRLQNGNDHIPEVRIHAHGRTVSGTDPRHLRLWPTQTSYTHPSELQSQTHLSCRRLL